MKKGKIFNAQEVQEILKGNKTMFREVIKNANYDSPVHSYKDWENNGLYYPVATEVDGGGIKTETQYCFDAIKCPYQVGQKIFVKESFWVNIKEIRVERLADISEKDCDKEGIGYTGGWNGEDYDDGEFFFGKLIETEDGMNWKNEMFEYPHLAFEKYWDSTHEKPEEKWEANPWVFVYSFEVVK